MSVLYSNLLYFLLFSIVATTIFWLTPKKYRSAVLLCINVLFYSLCAGWYIGFVLAVSGWSYFCANKISKIEEVQRRKKWLTCGIVPILLTLCFFKYWTPARSLIGEILHNAEGFNIVKIVLPLGMSYYILKSISYMVDVYRGKVICERNPINYLSYVSFYGQIVSGPIQRYEQWEQECKKEKPTKTYIDGFYHIMAGLFMKLVIANRLANFINVTFAAPNEVGGLQLWLGFFMYAVYIYCDFAGYSHIAIGVTNFLGLDCIDNFNRPYFSTNIREFWNRWHISLSSWLRDYVYIPLGGNRKGPARRVLNVMITFLTCGIWHGSTMSFVAWGAYHGFANVLTPKSQGRGGHNFLTILQSFWTFFIVATGWIFFASPTLTDALLYFKGMFTRLSLNATSVGSAVLPFSGDNSCVAFFLTVVFFILVLFIKEANDEFQFIRSTKTTSFFWQVFVMASVLLFGIFGANSFIYAGF